MFNFSNVEWGILALALLLCLAIGFIVGAYVIGNAVGAGFANEMFRLSSNDSYFSSGLNWSR